MKFVAFFCYELRYMMAPIYQSVSHEVVKSFPVAPHRLPFLNNYVAELKDVDYDVILLLADRWYDQELILSLLRKADIRKTVYIPRFGVMRDRTHIIDLTFSSNEGVEPFLYDRLIVLKNGAFDPYLGAVNGHICDHCFLNCKGCNNYSPFVKGRTLVSLDKWADTVQRITNSGFEVGSWFLFGGEPLLEPELTKDFVKVTRQFVSNREIVIHTNGILIPKMREDFWKTLVDNDITLNVTFYPPYYDMASNWWRILENYGVRKTYRKHNIFYKQLTKYPAHDPQVSVYNCPVSSCHYVREDYLYKCPEATFLNYVDKECGTDFEAESGGISIDELVANPLKSLDKLVKPIGLCRYCDPTHAVWENWELIHGKPNLEDWLIPEYKVCLD